MAPTPLTPLPLEVRRGTGHLAVDAFVLDAATEVPGDVGAVVGEVVGRTLGDPRPDAGPHVPLRLRLDEAAGPAGSASPERYTLEVGHDGVTVSAPAPAGLRHGAQVLARLVEHPGEGPARVGHVVVHDAPRYAWRGLSVDVARQFFGLDTLRTVVDLAASYRLNVLHLHLTDDQGWRIETPSRPELVGRSSGTDVSGGPGGHLTLADFRALQDHAARLGVTVVPEIDVPGHVNAATHAYGELREDGVPTDAYQGIEVGFSRLAFDLPATEPFLRDVFRDLAAATDGPYLHLGGDEAHATSAPEYARLVELAERVVRETGKIPVAWQEAARAPLRAGAVVQVWDMREDLGYLVDAAHAGARVVLSPANRVYLDMKYHDGFALGQDWAGLVELRDAYDWEPQDMVPGLPPESIEGVEAAVWTERIPTPGDLFTMLLPRLAAAAEVAWTAPGRKDWDGFRRRVAAEAPAWRRAGLSFHPTPQVDW